MGTTGRRCKGSLETRESGRKGIRALPHLFGGFAGGRGTGNRLSASSPRLLSATLREKGPGEGGVSERKSTKKIVVGATLEVWIVGP